MNKYIKLSLVLMGAVTYSNNLKAADCNATLTDLQSQYAACIQGVLGNQPLQTLQTYFGVTFQPAPINPNVTCAENLSTAQASVDFCHKLTQCMAGQVETIISNGCNSNPNSYSTNPACQQILFSCIFQADNFPISISTGGTISRTISTGGTIIGKIKH